MAAQNNPNQPGNNFTTDEYVLAYHGPLLYEARVSVCFKTMPRTMRNFCARSGHAIVYLSTAMLTFSFLPRAKMNAPRVLDVLITLHVVPAHRFYSLRTGTRPTPSSAALDHTISFTTKDGSRRELLDVGYPPHGLCCYLVTARLFWR